jgi:hypothetical protein
MIRAARNEWLVLGLFSGLMAGAALSQGLGSYRGAGPKKEAWMTLNVGDVVDVNGVRCVVTLTLVPVGGRR